MEENNTLLQRLQQAVKLINGKRKTLLVVLFDSEDLSGFTIGINSASIVPVDCCHLFSELAKHSNDKGDI